MQACSQITKKLYFKLLPGCIIQTNVYIPSTPPPKKEKKKRKKLFRFKIAYQDNLLLIMIRNAILRTI